MGQMEQGLHTVPVVVFMLEFDCYLNTQVIHSLVRVAYFQESEI